MICKELRERQSRPHNSRVEYVYTHLHCLMITLPLAWSLRRCLAILQLIHNSFVLILHISYFLHIHISLSCVLTSLISIFNLCIWSYVDANMDLSLDTTKTHVNHELTLAEPCLFKVDAPEFLLIGRQVANEGVLKLLLFLAEVVDCSLVVRFWCVVCWLVFV